MTGDSYVGFILLCLLALCVYYIGHKDGRKSGEAEVQAKQATAQKALEAANQAVDIATASQQARIEAAPPFDPPVALGQRFTYLGVEMLCIGHCFHIPPFGQVVPGIRAEYVDRDGRVISASFPAMDMESLRAELARAVPMSGETA